MLSHDIEMHINRHGPGSGLTLVRELPLAEAFDAATGHTLDAVGAGVGYAMSEGQRVIEFAEHADENVKVGWQMQLPCYRRGSNLPEDKARLILAVRARVNDTTGSSDPNADLALKADLTWHRSTFTTSPSGLERSEANGPGAPTSLTTPPGETLDADTTDAFEAFRWYYFDLTAAMTEAQREALNEHTDLTIRLYPSESVTDPASLPASVLRLQIKAARLYYRGHLAPPAIADRGLIQTN